MTIICKAIKACDHATEKDFDCSQCGQAVRKPLPDLFKPKRNELDKVFIGAPIISTNPCSMADMGELFTYTGGEMGILVTDCEVCRLPTVEESPRNVWLVPWLDRPIELNGLNVLIWLNDNTIFSTKKISSYNWKDVQAIMIIEDFKYDNY